MTHYNPLKVYARKIPYRLAEMPGLWYEKRNIEQNRWLRYIPHRHARVGGTHTATEWAYTIGLFQAVAYYEMKPDRGLDVLDVGCGRGRIGLAMGAVIGEGRYVGIDVNLKDVEWARENIDDPRYTFMHLPQNNPSYAAKQDATFPPYDLPDASFDFVTAVSVWTHLDEPNSIFYLNEVARVLRPGGKAMISFFYLDEDYRKFLAKGVPKHSAFSFREPSNYVFDMPAYGSEDFRYPSWVNTPEDAIGVTEAGMQKMLDASGLKLDAVHRGYWKEAVGLMFQDVVVFQKPHA